MIRGAEIVCFLLLCWLGLLLTASCQPKGKAQAPEIGAAGNKTAGPDFQNEPPRRDWPDAYPEPISLKGLRAVALKVYADRGIPSDRISTGAFDKEIERQAVQILRKAGIPLANENEADAVLNLDLYLVCGTDSSSCGYHTSLELKQWVRLSRNSSIVIAAATWSNSYSNGVSKNQISCCLPDLLVLDARSLLAGFV